MTLIRKKIRLLVIVVSLLIAVAVFADMSTETGVLTVNGWYEGEEIYYIDLGVEEGVSELGENDIYVIGSVPRAHQAQVVEFIPGEAGYSPNWNVHLVHTAYGVTVADILASSYVSEHYDEEGVLFDDVADIIAAEQAGLVFVERPFVVVLCPIISKEAAEAPGNHEAPEDFDILVPEDTF